MTSKTIRDSFFKSLSNNSAITHNVLRSLRIYFNNRQHNPRRQRDLDMERLIKAGPLRLSLQTEADFMGLLEARCFIKDKEWRNTAFTRLWGVRERNIMDDFRRLYLVEFRDEQDARSWTWERHRHPDHEGLFAVPVYRMADSHGRHFDFIIRPWQQTAQGKAPISFV